ncbi:3'-5' exonuclease, partial [Oenococcus oeni]|uniref:3'-5' exonuclease n=1 Tax=Oenococcus oeni TaxID=1247 RepID=UPI000AB6C29B
GIFPSARAMMERDGLEEERRLAYVAITRAQEELYLTNAFGRLLYGRAQSNKPSMFLDEIDDSLLDKENPSSSRTQTLSDYDRPMPFDRKSETENQIKHDYLITDRLSTKIVDGKVDYMKKKGASAEEIANIRSLWTVNIDYLQRAIDTVKSLSGDPITYLHDYIHLEDKDIDALRDKY